MSPRIPISMNELVPDRVKRCPLYPELNQEAWKGEPIVEEEKHLLISSSLRPPVDESSTPRNEQQLYQAE